jgi:hypothetical protein
VIAGFQLLSSIRAPSPRPSCLHFEFCLPFGSEPHRRRLNPDFLRQGGASFSLGSTTGELWGDSGGALALFGRRFGGAFPGNLIPPALSKSLPRPNLLPPLQKPLPRIFFFTPAPKRTPKGPAKDPLFSSLRATPNLQLLAPPQLAPASPQNRPRQLFFSTSGTATPVRHPCITQCNTPNSWQPRRHSPSSAFAHSLPPWPLDIAHSRRRAIRATPPRQTNPPTAQPTQPKTSPAISKPHLPPQTHQLFFNQTNPPRTTPPAIRATPFGIQRSDPRPSAAPSALGGRVYSARCTPSAKHIADRGDRAASRSRLSTIEWGS